MTKNFDVKFFLLVYNTIIYCEYMARIDMKENIVTQKFLTQNFQ